MQEIVAESAASAEALSPLFGTRREASQPASAPTEALPPDEALMGTVAKGGGDGRRALAELFRRHGEPLGRFLYRLVGRQQEAEDLIQDVFVRVAEKAPSFRGESPFRTWLFSLALNIARSHQRRAALEERVDREWAARRPDSADHGAGTDPVAAAQNRELLQRLDRALAQVPEPEREIFLLYWFGKLPYAEISRLTGVSVSAAKVRVHRALGRIHRALGDGRA